MPRKCKNIHFKQLAKGPLEKCDNIYPTLFATTMKVVKDKRIWVVK